MFPWCNSELKIAAIKRAEAHIRERVLQDTNKGKEEYSFKREADGIPVDLVQLVYGGTKDRGNQGSGKPNPFSESAKSQGAKINTVSYIGIASDEKERLHNIDGKRKISPLVLIGWTEADAKKWCEENKLLSPIYTDGVTRGGCWFCHNQPVGQLRTLRKEYPDLWALLMKWDLDSPISFKQGGITIHDFDKRFQMEDEGKVPKDKRFRWKMLEEKE